MHSSCVRFLGVHRDMLTCSAKEGKLLAGVSMMSLYFFHPIGK